MTADVINLGKRLVNEVFKRMDIFVLRDAINEYASRDVDIGWCPDLYDVAEYCIKNGDNLDDSEVDEWLWTNIETIHEALKEEESND